MNHVSQPTALALKEAKWVKETTATYQWSETRKEWVFSRRAVMGRSWLPAPNISEIRERLTKVNLRDYWFAVIRLVRIGGNRTLHEAEYSEWLYTVTASADLLAEVWIWTRRNP